jgi:hypothetical protein
MPKNVDVREQKTENRQKKRFFCKKQKKGPVIFGAFFWRCFELPLAIGEQRSKMP